MATTTATTILIILTHHIVNLAIATTTTTATMVGRKMGSMVRPARTTMAIMVNTALPRRIITARMAMGSTMVAAIMATTITLEPTTAILCVTHAIPILRATTATRVTHLNVAARRTRKETTPSTASKTISNRDRQQAHAQMHKVGATPHRQRATNQTRVNLLRQNTLQAQEEDNNYA